MKMRTKMICRDGEWSAESPSDFYPICELQHDAAYAHALLRALRQAPDMDYQRKWIIGRADELMGQWGYGEVTE